VRFGACFLGAFAVHASVSALPALAQHADAGVPARAAAPTAPTEQKAQAERKSDEPSGVLPKTINPALLSEGVRARLEERVSGRHASALPQAPELRGASSATAGPAMAPPRAMSEPLRRGQARARVQAVETDEGVTILSNRLQALPTPRLASLVAQRPAPQQELPEDDGVAPAAVVSASDVTQTHSLRPLSSRSVKGKGTGLGWLLWPFALFVTSAAVVSALWFRKKTE
jgi:hypothetical protein